MKIFFDKYQFISYKIKSFSLSYNVLYNIPFLKGAILNYLNSINNIETRKRKILQYRFVIFLYSKIFTEFAILCNKLNYKINNYNFFMNIYYII